MWMDFSREVATDQRLAIVTPPSERMGGSGNERGRSRWIWLVLHLGCGVYG
jgi:hypothetical protein